MISTPYSPIPKLLTFKVALPLIKIEVYLLSPIVIFKIPIQSLEPVIFKIPSFPTMNEVLIALTSGINLFIVKVAFVVLAL